MNISLLSVKMMIGTTRNWLRSAKVRQYLMNAGSLGKGILDELEDAHAFLADLANRRRQLHEQLRAIITLITNLDTTHDRKARSLYYALDSLIEAADDPKQAEEYERIKALLFPIGLRVVRLPYIEESGSAEELDRSVDAKIRAKLAAITIGQSNLAQLFEQWIEAGQALGEAIAERAELEASLTRKGSAVEQVDIRVGRKKWLQAVRGLLWALEVRVELEPLSEAIEASLASAIEISKKRRQTTGGEAADVEDEAEEVLEQDLDDMIADPEDEAFEDEEFEDEEFEDEEFEDEDEDEDEDELVEESA